MGQTLPVGSRVRVTQPIDLAPYTTLEPGEEGTVSKVVTAPSGQPAPIIHLDKIHTGLSTYGNTALLVEPEINYIEPVKSKRFGKIAAVIGGGGLIVYGVMKLHVIHQLLSVVTALAVVVST